jgi:hypothetical protein
MIRTPHYVQISGTLKGQNLNIKGGDQGGELDPHGGAFSLLFLITLSSVASPSSPCRLALSRSLLFLPLPNGRSRRLSVSPSAADGLGNPHGAVVLSTVNGKLTQIKEWNSFISDTEFCIRACYNGPDAWRWWCVSSRLVSAFPPFLVR